MDIEKDVKEILMKKRTLTEMPGFFVFEPLKRELCNANLKPEDPKPNLTCAERE
jgi:hypothetical protein